MKYTVYIHINKSNGKKYIGITRMKPNDRWKNGYGYKSVGKQTHFYNAILKYGWNNFDHIIVRSNMPEACAKTLEKILIQKYNTTDRNLGYNISTGGDGGAGYNRNELKYLSGSYDNIKHKNSYYQRNMRSVLGFRDDFKIQFNSVTEAAEYFNITPTAICRSLKGYTKTCCGLKWTYLT